MAVQRFYVAKYLPSQLPFYTLKQYTPDERRAALAQIQTTLRG